MPASQRCGHVNKPLYLVFEYDRDLYRTTNSNSNQGLFNSWTSQKTGLEDTADRISHIRFVYPQSPRFLTNTYLLDDFVLVKGAKKNEARLKQV